MTPAQLVTRNTDLLRNTSDLGPVLDLACGDGRNGLYLLHTGLKVVFADIREDALARVSAAAGARPAPQLWQIDLEAEQENPLQGRQFGAILVFRYLHRPLMPAIANAVAPGGVVMYETFTVDQARHGRPNNPDYLLRYGELSAYFPGWETLHHFEGEQNGPFGHSRAIAQLIARKPRV